MSVPTNLDMENLIKEKTTAGSILLIEILLNSNERRKWHVIIPWRSKKFHRPERWSFIQFSENRSICKIFIACLNNFYSKQRNWKLLSRFFCLQNISQYFTVNTSNDSRQSLIYVWILLPNHRNFILRTRIFKLSLENFGKI